MDIIFIAIAVCLVLFFAAIVATAVYTFKDAKQIGANAEMWTLITILSGGLGGFAYLLKRRNIRNTACKDYSYGQDEQYSYGQDESCHNTENANVKAQSAKRNKRLLTVFVCVVITLYALFGFCSVSPYVFGGFSVACKYKSHTQNGIVIVEKQVDKSFGNKWKLSYAKAKEHYALEKIYCAKSEPVSLIVEIQCHGTIRLTVSQNETSFDETIGSGSYIYDMTVFNKGLITITITNIDGSNFNSALEIIT